MLWGSMGQSLAYIGSKTVSVEDHGSEVADAVATLPEAAPKVPRVARNAGGCFQLADLPPKDSYKELECMLGSPTAPHHVEIIPGSRRSSSRTAAVD